MWSPTNCPCCPIHQLHSEEQQAFVVLHPRVPELIHSFAPAITADLPGATATIMSSTPHIAMGYLQFIDTYAATLQCHFPMLCPIF